MSPHRPGTWIDRSSGGNEDVLPRPLTRRVRVFPLQSPWQVHVAKTRSQIRRVQRLHTCQMLPQQRHQPLRQHRHPVLEALSLAHQDFAASEVHVLNAQSQALHHAHPRTVKQPEDQPRGSVDRPQQALNFFGRQHYGQTLAGLRRLDIIQPGEIGPQHFLVEKQQSALCLILRGCGNPPLHREVGEKRFDLARAHFLRMSLAMEKDETSHPRAIA